MEKHKLPVVSFFTLTMFLASFALNSFVLPNIAMAATVKTTVATKTVAKVKVAEISEVKGKVAINNKTPKLRDAIYVGDKIVTAKDGYVSLIFTKDKSLLRINKLSYIVIQQSNPQKTVIEVKTGGLWARILKAVGAKDDFQIKTKSTSASIRGTSAFFDLSRTSQLNIKVINSYNTDAKQLGVTVTNSQLKKTYQVKPAQSITVSDVKKVLQAQKLSLPQEFQDNTFIKENVRKDLVYMSDLVATAATAEGGAVMSANYIKKVSGELGTSMPTPAQTEALFYNQDVAKKANGESTSTTNNGGGASAIAPQELRMLIMQDECIKNVAASISDKTLAKEVADQLANTDISQFKNNTAELTNALANIAVKAINDSNQGKSVDTNAIMNAAKDSTNNMTKDTLSVNNVLAKDLQNKPTNVACAANEHKDPDLKQCVSNSLGCLVSTKGVASAEKIWNTNRGAWNTCAPTMCSPGYTLNNSKAACEKNQNTVVEKKALNCGNTAHVENGVCTLNTQSCEYKTTLENNTVETTGWGIKTWEDGYWSPSCEATSCKTGWRLTGGVCFKNDNTTNIGGTVLRDTSIKTTVDEELVIPHSSKDAQGKVSCNNGYHFETVSGNAAPVCILNTASCAVTDAYSGVNIYEGEKTYDTIGKYWKGCMYTKCSPGASRTKDIYGQSDREYCAIEGTKCTNLNYREGIWKQVEGKLDCEIPTTQTQSTTTTTTTNNNNDNTSTVNRPAFSNEPTITTPVDTPAASPSKAPAASANTTTTTSTSGNTTTKATTVTTSTGSTTTTTITTTVDEPKISCPRATHIEGDACVSNADTNCTPTVANSKTWQRTWNSNSKSWGACITTTCKEGYYAEIPWNITSCLPYNSRTPNAKASHFSREIVSSSWKNLW